MIHVDYPEKYKIRFKDIHNSINNIEVTERVYKMFNTFELEDLSEMNEYDRHIEHSALTEITLNMRSIQKEMQVEDLVIKNIEYKNLYQAIMKLTNIQKRRILLHFFYELTYKEIAIIEKTSIRAIQYTISRAIKNLKKILK